MDPDPIKNSGCFNRISDFSEIWSQCIDQGIRQFPLELNFLGHCMAPSLHCRVESFHNKFTMMDEARWPSYPQRLHALVMMGYQLSLRFDVALLN